MATKPRKKQANIITPVPTIIEFLLDETGSMASYLSSTIGGFNDFVKDQRSEDDLCLMTLTKFDTSGLKTPYVNLNLSMVPDLTKDTFVPAAMTNLRDAINTRIAALNGSLSQWDVVPRVLFICMTDGDDNASRSSVDETRNNIVQHMDNNGWTFVYMGAHDRAIEAGKALGFPEGNIKCFSGAEMQEVYQETSRATTVYRAEAMAGSSYKSFYNNI